MERIYGKICRAHGNLRPMTMWHLFGYKFCKEGDQRIICMKGADDHGTEHASVIERGERTVLVRWHDNKPGYICQVTRGHQPGETNKPIMA